MTDLTDLHGFFKIMLGEKFRQVFFHTDMLLSKRFSALFLILFCFIFPQWLAAQNSQENTSSMLGLTITYGFQFPAGDLSDRFGRNSSVGGSLDYLTEKGNLIFGIKGGILFGNIVKENVLTSISPSGILTGNNQVQANVVLRQRGLYTSALFGKLFALLKNNKRSGIRATIGLGLLQHKIRVQEDPESFTPQIAGDYAKGYDRLSNGLAITEFIGYQHLSKNRLINFYAGFEFMQGFTKNRRSVNFDTMSKDDTSRTDLLLGFKMGWTLPFYIGDNPEEIFY